MSTTLEKATFPDLGKEQCIALTTFRNVQRLLQRKAKVEVVYIAIEPVAGL